MAAGYPVGADAGERVYGAATTAAVRAFQRDRGLRVDGFLGHQTWSALVEAGYRPGERLLYHSQPMLRGDDVADLQRRLGDLGFDGGRVDGIFGPDTLRAVVDFQRNAGLVADGIVGPVTMQALQRLRSRGEGNPVAGVREREALRSRSATVHGRRVAVGEEGGLDALARTVERALSHAGASPTVLHHPDPGQLAQLANAIGADAYIGLSLDPELNGVATAFYAGHGYESPGGRQLAALVQAELTTTLAVPDLGVAGMAVPVLRETRMPAVVCSIGPPRVLVEGAVDVANALTRGYLAWSEAPCT